MPVNFPLRITACPLIPGYSIRKPLWLLRLPTQHARRHAIIPQGRPGIIYSASRYRETPFLANCSGPIHDPQSSHWDVFFGNPAVLQALHRTGLGQIGITKPKGKACKMRMRISKSGINISTAYIDVIRGPIPAPDIGIGTKSDNFTSFHGNAAYILREAVGRIHEHYR